jgi:hypothetical protein
MSRDEPHRLSPRRTDVESLMAQLDDALRASRRELETDLTVASMAGRLDADDVLDMLSEADRVADAARGRYRDDLLKVLEACGFTAQ